MDDRQEDYLGITIGEASYTSPAAEFMYTRGKEIEARLKTAATQPKTVSEALFIRHRRKNLDYLELLEEVIAAQPDWKTAAIDVLEKEFAQQSLDPATVKEIEQNAAMIEAVTKKMAERDSSQVQLAIVKNTGKREEYAYTYLVVYPPDPETGVRAREVSYPTAMCHLVDANALLTQAESVTCEGEKYKVSFNQTHPVSDEELGRVVRETGRTPLDKVIQAGLKVIDHLAKRKGEHIDPASAVSNREYAVKYALATHRGVGLIDNERIVLPPLIK